MSPAISLRENRMRAYVIAAAAVAVLSLTLWVAFGPDQDENTVVKLQAVPKVDSAISSKNESLTTLVAGQVAQISFHDFNFDEANGTNWASEEITLTPPAGWQRVAVSVAGSWLYFKNENRPLYFVGTNCGVRLDGTTLKLTAYALLRDNNADDPFAGRVTVKAIFLQ